MHDSNCIFCKIVDGKVAASKIYENDRVLAFLDVEPRAPGHTLVVPKYHAETMGDLPEEDIAPLFLAVRKVTGMLVESLEAHGATIGINQSAAAGQVVGHLHIHVVPRFHNDGGGALQSVVNNAPKESLKEIKAKIIKK